jgi:hypothetical protein
VSSGVARKEHGEFSSNIDLIDTLPPGLYEAVFHKADSDTANRDLVSGEWVMKCEARTLDDIRALGGNDVADDRRFATAARVSETNLALYRTFAQPIIKNLVNAPVADWLQQMHPLRLQYQIFSDANPFMAPVAALAEQVRNNRKPAAADNPFLALQEAASRQFVSMFDTWRDASETLAERAFLSIYGSPALQAACGVNPDSAAPLRRAPRSPLHRQLIQAKIAELRSRFTIGGLREALVRALIYVGMARASVDERSFEMIRRIRATQDEMPRLSLAEFKALVREQYFMLLIDQVAAVAAIPALLPSSADKRRKALAVLREVVAARGEPTGQGKARFDQMAEMFEAGGRNIEQRPSAIVTFESTNKIDRPLAS